MYAHRSQPSVLVQEVIVVNRGVCSNDALFINIYYSLAGRSVSEETVPKVLNTADAIGRGQYSRPRAQFLSIRTDLGG